MNIELISRFFERDHDRLDEVFQEYQGLKHHDFQEARQRFDQFETALARHMAWEEQVIFPLFETKSGLHEGGPTAIMRMEHRQIRQALENMKQKIADGSPNTGRLEEELLAALGNHHLKEESLLYPMIDNSVTEAERKTILAQLARVPEDRMAAMAAIGPEGEKRGF